MIVTLYDLSTGRIKGVLDSIQQVIDDTVAATGHDFIEGAHDWRTEYVLDHVAVARPANPAVLSGMTITNLPNPSTVVIGEQEYQVTDGTADLEFDQPGTYRVVVRAWPFQDKEFTVENPA